jgi:hypothetical protein
MISSIVRKTSEKVLGKKMTAFLVKILISISIKKTVRLAHTNNIDFTADTVINLLFSKKARHIKPW